mmetsp:Transcript_33134/g.77720  ORF Transcript_33134/g.77720 Transcript_33134/m.77720 type:complete len:133 (+) Transcript_33134:2-400(+)
MSHRLEVLASHLRPHDEQIRNNCGSRKEQRVFGAAYLEGNFGPVQTEKRSDALPVLQGHLPPALNGMYLRNGPNPQFDLRGKPYHWFDGDGMLHGVVVSNGRASYINRWVRTKRWERDHQQGFCDAELGHVR